MSQPVKVLHVIDSLAPGGTERVLVELVNNFDKARVRPCVCVTRSDMRLAQSIEGGIPVYRLNRQRKIEWAKLRKFGQIVRQNDIHIIHTHGYSSFQFAVIAKVCCALRTPLIIHAHDSAPPSRFTRLLARFDGAHFIGVAPQIVEWGRQLLGFSAFQTTLLGNAIQTAGYFAAKPVNISPYFNTQPRWVGLVIANVRPVKDFATLFQALAASKFRSEIGILIAGSIEDRDYVERCRHLLKELRLKDRVVLMGSRQDIPQLLASVDFGVLSSKRESGPIALLEYMAGGVPFVVTRVGEIGNAVADAGLPAAVQPGNPAAFAETLDQLLALSKEEQQKRGETGRRMLLEHFSIEARITHLQDIYFSLLD